MEPLAHRAKGAHCLLPWALALCECLEVAAVAPDPVDAVDSTALHFQREDSDLGQDDYVRLAPDLGLVAGQAERMKHNPGVRQIAPEPFVYVALAVRAVLWYLRYQDGQLVPPMASPK